MAHQYEKRKMFQGPGLFIVIIPFGAIFFFILFDFCFKFYNDYALGKDTEEVLTLVLEKDGLDTYEDMKAYAIEQFKRLGYEDNDDLSLIIKDDYVILVNYKTYFSMMGVLTGKTERLAIARYKGYYNEYKETVVEKFESEEDEEEDLIEDNSLQPNEDIKIN